MDGYKTPREDINAPDFYIPLMGFVTYILLEAIKMGFNNNFHPDVLTGTASTAFFIILIEVFVVKFGCYLLNVSVSISDLISYCSYKFVPYFILI